MKNINILSDIEKARLKDENLFWKRMEQLIIVAVVGVVIFLGLSSYLAQCKKTEANIRNKNANIQSQINKARQMSKKEFNNIEAEITKLNYILNDKSANVSNYIKSIEESEAKYIWIDKIEYKGDSFVIEGTSVSASDMGPEKRIYEFEERLEKTKLYKRIELMYLDDNNGSILGENSSSDLSVKKFEYELFI